MRTMTSRCDPAARQYGPRCRGAACGRHSTDIGIRREQAGDLVSVTRLPGPPAALNPLPDGRCPSSTGAAPSWPRVRRDRSGRGASPHGLHAAAPSSAGQMRDAQGPPARRRPASALMRVSEPSGDRAARPAPAPAKAARVGVRGGQSQSAWLCERATTPPAPIHAGPGRPAS